MTSAILTEFDSNPERMAAEIARLRERLTETWAMASRHHKTALRLSHRVIRESGLRLEDGRDAP